MDGRAPRWKDPDYVGSLAWTDRTGGRLRPRDRLRILGQGVAMQLSEIPPQLLGRLRLRKRGFRFDLDDLVVPDTPAAKAAEAVADRMRPEMLVRHSYRTYVWAAILGARRGVRFDEEVVYVGSLLHDYGLAEGHRDAPPCFTLIGAGAARECGASAGWEPARTEAAAEAITLHMNLNVPRDAVEAALVARATQLDVIGRGYFGIAPETVARVLERHPRGPAKAQMREIFRRQASEHPGSRAHMHQRYFGLGLLIQTAPFDE